MKKTLIATALALIGFAPAIASACEDYDATSASATPPAQLATPAPAATKVPAKVAKASPSKAVTTLREAKPVARDEKVAAASIK